MEENLMAPADLLQPVLAQIQEDGVQALASLDDLILSFADDPRLHFLRGSVLAGLEQYGPARTAMRRAIDIAPDYALARFQLGLLELTSGEPYAAQSTWHPLLSLPGDNPLNIFVRGLEKLIADEYRASIALLEEGMARNTELPPMNRDMMLLVQQMQDKLNESPVADDVESGANFLLKQYSFKGVKH